MKTTLNLIKIKQSFNFRVKIFSLFLFLVAILVFPQHVFATTTLEVGSGQTYTTIQDAVDAIPSTLTEPIIINIHAGTYTRASGDTSNGVVRLQSKTTSTTNTIIFQANESDTVIIDGEGTKPAFRPFSVSNVTIKGIQAKSCTDHCVIPSGANNIQLLNNIIHSGGWRAITISSGSNITIRNNTIYSNGVNGIWLLNSSSITVDGNTLYRNGSDGIVLSSSTNVTIKNNILADCGTSGSCTTQKGVSINAGSSATLSNNDINDYPTAISGTYTDGGGNITTAPTFLSVDSTNSKFLFIDPTSPAYTAGVGGIPMGGRYVATPISLAQYKANGSSQISSGSSTDEKSIILKANLSTSMYTDTLTPEIEVKALGTAFNGSSTTVGSGSSYSGSAVTNSTTFNCLSKSSYHWRMRVSNSAGVYSDWALFGSSSSTDFIINNSCSVGLTLNNDPQGAPDNKIRLNGKAVLTDGSYTISSVEYNVNGGGWNGATAKDGTFNSTSEEFYFNFDPKSNQPKDSSGNLIDGYTIQVRSTNSNADVTDHLFYFQPFNLNEPLDNASSTLSYPTFDFSVNRQRSNLKDNLSKYQIQVKKSGNQTTTVWETLIDDIPVDFSSVQTSGSNIKKNDYQGKDPNNGNGVYETDKFIAIYSDDSSRIKVYSKINKVSGSIQWKVVAIDKLGHTQESGSRFLRVNTNQTLVSTNYFPLAILNISGYGNPNIATTNLSSIKDAYSIFTTTPIFYGIAVANSVVSLQLTDPQNVTTTYTATTNPDSRFGINIPKGDLTYGKTYTALMSVAYNQDYNELPSFTLAVGGSGTTTKEPAVSPSPETKTTITPNPTPKPPQSTQTAPSPKKTCFLFVCF